MPQRAYLMPMCTCHQGVSSRVVGVLYEHYENLCIVPIEQALGTVVTESVPSASPSDIRVLGAIRV